MAIRLQKIMLAISIEENNVSTSIYHAENSNDFDQIIALIQSPVFDLFDKETT